MFQFQTMKNDFLELLEWFAKCYQKYFFIIIIIIIIIFFLYIYKQIMHFQEDLTRQQLP